MVDPFSALGLASSIITCIEFSTRLVKEGVERYRSPDGTVQGHVAIEVVAADLSRLTEPLTEPDLGNVDPARLSQDEKTLRKLAMECKSTADDLLDILRELKQSKTRWPTLDALRKSIRSQRHSKEIDRLEKNLDRYRREIDTAILSKLLKTNSSISSTIFSLVEASRRLAKDTESSMQINAGRLERAREDILFSIDRLEKASNNSSITTELSKLSKDVTRLAEQGREVSMQQKILNSLYFHGINYRLGKEVVDPEKDTFEWAWDDTPSVKLRSWLEKGEGIFWVSGKPGSGKSTFMKHICHDDRTRSALDKWAQQKPVVMVEFYFWNDGDLEQKSQRGLLRSLLFQILCQVPDLVSSVCSDRWGTDNIRKMSWSWSLIELTNCFRKLSEHQLPMKFCCFIDGLDEFDPNLGDGEHEDLLACLKSAEQQPDFKLCLSTRPWAFVENELALKNTIFMENLTRDCIQKYTFKKLGNDENFRRLHDQQSGLQNMTTDVVRKSEGVFLWVYLVIRSLLRGVRKGDTVNELQQKLNTMPNDLEKFFRRSINAVEPEYQMQSAQVLQIAQKQLQPLSILAYKCLDDERENSEYAMEAPIEAYEGDIEELYRLMRLRLHARTVDLLEVNDVGSGTSFLRYKVNFIHRTVKDFLRDSRDMVSLFQERAPDFEPVSSLCKASLAQLKTFPVQSISTDINEVYGLVDETAYYARQLALRERSRLRENYSTKLLDELDRVMIEHYPGMVSMNVHWTAFRDTPDGLFHEGFRSDFLSYAIQTDLQQYVSDRLTDARTLRAKKGRPYLDYALRPMFLTSTAWPMRHGLINQAMIDILLHLGANPNQPIHLYDGKTPWTMFLSSCYELAPLLNNRSANERRAVQLAQINAIESLLLADADPSINKCDVRVRQSIYRLGVFDILQHIMPHGEADRLQRMMIAKQEGRSWGIWKWLWS